MTHHRCVNCEILHALTLMAGTALVGCSDTNNLTTIIGPSSTSSTGGATTGTHIGGSAALGGISGNAGGASSSTGGTSAGNAGGTATASGGTSANNVGGTTNTSGGTSASKTGGTTSTGGVSIGGSSSTGTRATGGTSTGVGGTSTTTGGTKVGTGGTSGGGITSSGGSAATGGTGGKTGSGGTGAASCNAKTYADKGDGLAMTPPMGWNSWNKFQSNISDSTIRKIADAMVSSGMKDAGYIYVNIDDTWMQAGRVNGKLTPDAKKFPKGISDLATYVHGKGLKLGIYGDRGTMTCSNITESGSFGHETDDAQTWASWGIDYVKYDNCNVGTRDGDAALQEDYEKMGSALKATGRPMVYSLCAWGWKGEWMIPAGHLWRATGDIADCWDNTCTLKEDWQNGFTTIVDQVVSGSIAKYAGPGHWNDADMLEVGNGHLTNTEYISHFSLWSIMASPLIAGNDLSTMDTATKNILLNKEVIAVDQDPAGIQGTRVVDEGDLEVWMKPLGSCDGTEKAVVLFNRSAVKAKISVSFADIGLSGAATVRDLWAAKDLGSFTDSFAADVESHGVVMVKVVRTGS